MGEDFGLDKIKSETALKAESYLDEIQEELVEEEQTALKDFVKGAYRVLIDKQKQIEGLQKEVVEIKVAINEAGKGEWEKLAQIKIPAKFFDEKTLRYHGKSLLEGESELRFVDLYVEEKK